MDALLAFDDRLICSLLVRARAHSGVRLAAESLLNGSEISQLHIESTVAALDTSRRTLPSDRLLATALIPRLHLNESFRRESQRYLIEVVDSEPEADSSVLHALWVLAFFPFVTPFAPIIQQGRVNRLRALAIRALGEMECVAAVDSLARALWDSPGAGRTLGRDAVRHAAAESLIKLLPLVTECDRIRLAPETVPNLARALRTRNEPLALAILESFTRIAGGEALHPVRLASRQGCTATIRQHASALIPTLEQRRLEEIAPSTLLRAAESGDMLRPAVDNPARWLRPAIHRE